VRLPIATKEQLTKARLEGARLAIRTVRHALATKLAVVAGQAELLADDPRLPPELHEQASKLSDSALAAAEVVAGLDADLVELRLDRTLAGPSLLDVKRSLRPRQR
jgi:signal transduction histidine kinase